MKAKFCTAGPEGAKPEMADSFPYLAKAICTFEEMTELTCASLECTCRSFAPLSSTNCKGITLLQVKLIHVCTRKFFVMSQSVFVVFSILMYCVGFGITDTVR